MKRIQFWAFALSVLLVLSLGGCSLPGGKGDSAPDPDPPAEQTDTEYPVSAGGITLESRPGSVVSLAPSLTEKLYDLGLEDRLSGVSDYCDYPEAIVGLPTCGTAQFPDLEEIAALEPHLVLTESPLADSDLAALEALDIPVAVLPHAATIDALMANYRDLARLLLGETSGALLGDSFVGTWRDQLDRLSAAMAAYTSTNGRKKVLYLRMLDFTVATGDTFEHQLLEAICVDNIAAAFTGWEYPQEAAKTSDGAAAFTSVDLIYLDEGYVTIKDLEQSAFYKGLPATIKDRYLPISSLSLERQSLRSLFQLEDMARGAYPEADLSALTGSAPSGGRKDIEGDTEPDYGGDDSARAQGEAMVEALEKMP